VAVAVHGFADVQAAPCVQASPATQVLATHWWAALQTRPGPQGASSGRKAASTHTGVPEAQEVVPAVAHGLVGAQGAPSWQASQAPAAEQTSPAPQGVPGGWLRRSVQTAAPLEHS
jgi:hypothetical protein